ncbi:unnamed protein product [Acanthosepion pharaonis]|uniref:Secreted protein n=1 Tax=Acanthosepion pharaonis TaxID=158019 RepID=A0A812BES2_ACAPH|nr:unnamed protein product [Sepia pharaonis]
MFVSLCLLCVSSVGISSSFSSFKQGSIYIVSEVERGEWNRVSGRSLTRLFSVPLNSLRAFIFIDVCQKLVWGRGDDVGELVFPPPVFFIVFAPEKLIISHFGSFPLFSDNGCRHYSAHGFFFLLLASLTNAPQWVWAAPSPFFSPVCACYPSVGAGSSTSFLDHSSAPVTSTIQRRLIKKDIIQNAITS